MKSSKAAAGSVVLR